MVVMVLRDRLATLDSRQAHHCRLGHRVLQGGPGPAWLLLSGPFLLCLVQCQEVCVRATSFSRRLRRNLYFTW